MRIALVIFRADPSRGGAERYTADLAAALAARGQEVTIVSAEPGPSVAGAGQVAIRAAGLMRHWRYRHFLDELDAHLGQQRYDVVHAMLPVRRCDLYHPHAGIEAENIEKAAGLARMLNRLNAKRRAFVTVERELLSGPQAPVVLCLSEYIKSAVRRHYNVPEERLVTLFNGVDTERFDPAGRAAAAERLRATLESEKGLKIGTDRVVALMIANDFERKGLRQAIEAVGQVDDPRLLLVVVGKPDPFDYAAQAMRLGLQDQVAFVGPTTDAYAFYSLADFFVLPTHHDPCSLVVLEALAMGLPVISTRANGACEIMVDGVNGYVMPDPNDVPALAGMMRRMLTPQVRERMREANVQLRERLSFGSHVESLLRIYERVRASPTNFRKPDPRPH